MANALTAINSPAIIPVVSPRRRRPVAASSGIVATTAIPEKALDHVTPSPAVVHSFNRTVYSPMLVSWSRTKAHIGPQLVETSPTVTPSSNQRLFQPVLWKTRSEDITVVSSTQTWNRAVAGPGRSFMIARGHPRPRAFATPNGSSVTAKGLLIGSDDRAPENPNQSQRADTTKPPVVDRGTDRARAQLLVSRLVACQQAMRARNARVGRLAWCCHRIVYTINTFCTCSGY